MSVDLCNKSKVVLLHRHLKYLLEKKVQLVHVHSGIIYKQSNWLASHIDHMINLRRDCKANSDAIGELFTKKSVVSLWGYLYSNTGNQERVKVCKTREECIIAGSSSSFQNVETINSSTNLFTFKKDKAFYGYSVIATFAILQHSIVELYKSHDKFMSNFPNLQLIGCNIDELTYKFVGSSESLYNHFNKIREMMDFTTLPINHPLYHPTENAMTPLKWKFVHSQILEYVSIKPRKTSLLLPCQMCRSSFTFICEMCKLVLNSDYDTENLPPQVKARIRHDLFRKRLRSDGLTIVPQPTCCSIENSAIQFSASTTLDVRRYLLPDGNSTLCHGHYLIT